jgi:hypothetical protein
MSALDNDIGTLLVHFLSRCWTRATLLSSTVVPTKLETHVFYAIIAHFTAPVVGSLLYVPTFQATTVVQTAPRRNGWGSNGKMDAFWRRNTWR